MQDLNDKVTGGTLTADEWNEVPSEIQNVIEALNITLSGGDLNQLNKAVAAYSAVGQFMTGGGIADAYTANAPSPRVNPPARLDGMIVRFIATATNTGACTLNAFGLGVDDIKLSDGTTDPSAGDIVAGKEVKVIDRSSYFELIRAGRVKTTVITASEAAWAYQPDAKTAVIEGLGPGGGGGGVDGQGAATAACSVAGAAGGWSKKEVQNPSGTLNITIGSIGAGGPSGNNAGTNGGDTTVVGTGVNLTMEGGDGGLGDLGSASSLVVGARGGDATGGDINQKGGDSTHSTVGSSGRQSLSLSGASYFSGAESCANNIDGTDATGYGVGGGATSNALVSDNRAGGDGGPSVVIITEYL